MDFRQIWWTRVPNAARLIADAARQLQDWKSVAVSADESDWLASFCEAVQDAVERENLSISFYSLDLAAVDPDATITEAIADRLNIGLGGNCNIASLKAELPEGGSVWHLEHMNDARRTELTKLLRHVVECGAHISFMFANPGGAKLKSCWSASWKSDRQDLQYYAWSLLMESGVPRYLMEYAGALAVELAGGSVEKCAAVCENIQEFLNDPVAACGWLTPEEARSRVHTAQVRGIEPCLEYGRVYLIKLLGTRLRKLMPLEDEFGYIYNEPYELEIRHIMYNRGDLSPNEAEKALMNMLHDARNKISHLDILTYEETTALLAGSEQWQKA